MALAGSRKDRCAQTFHYVYEEVSHVAFSWRRVKQPAGGRKKQLREGLLTLGELQESTAI